MNDSIVNEKHIKQAKHDLYKLGRFRAHQRLAATEPALAATIDFAAKHALEHIRHLDPDERARDNIVDAVAWAALIAVEALHQAHYDLWKRTSMGSLLAQIDPTLRKRTNGADGA